MKLLECYIENFGRISQRSYSFADGINCLVGENGSGKSTLAAFIKVMLYGMSDTKKTSLEENERKHYLPWNGSACGGWLSFKTEKGEYRVERGFAPKAADDSFTLYDLKTGKASEDFSASLGQELFGIDADGFERTVFLSERMLTPDGENKSVSAKLSDLVGCEGDIGEMDKALDRLEKERKFYQKRGGSGELSQIKAQISEINSQLDSVRDAEELITRLEKRLTELDGQMRSAVNERDNLINRRAEAMVRSEVGKRHAEMKARVKAAEDTKAELQSLLGDEPPSFDRVDAEAYAAKEAEAIERSLSDVYASKEYTALSDFFADRISKEEIDSLDGLVAGLRGSRTPAILAFGGITLIGILLGLIIDPILLAISAVGIIGLAIMLVKSAGDRATRAKLCELCSRFGNSDEDIAKFAEEIKEKYKKYQALKLTEEVRQRDHLAKRQRAEALRRQSTEFLSRFGGLSYDSLRERLHAYLKVCESLRVARDELNEFEAKYGLSDGTDEAQQCSVEEIDIQRTRLEEGISSIRAEYSLCEITLKKHTATVDGKYELIMQLAECEERLAKYTENYDVIMLTRKYLTDARESMTAKYIGKTKESFIEYTRTIGGDSGERFEMNTDFEVSRLEGKGARPAEAYSRGTRDLYNIASRLALTDSLYGDEKPFIILDDPFTALDDQRTKAALELLRSISDQRQIIYFTCSKSRAL